MLEKYNHYFYRIVRLIIFTIITYGLLKYIPSNEIIKSDIIKLVILFTVLFIAIDCYYPNIYFE